MDAGSPLKVYADKLRDSVQEAYDKAGVDVVVRNGMAYSSPYVWDAMAEFEKLGRDDILVLPMFPQFSTATTASVFHEVKKAASKWSEPPTLKFVDDLYSEPAFINAWSRLIKESIDSSKIDHVIFSYHGVPESNLKKADANGVCNFGSCCDQITDKNRLCYRAQCVATTRGIVQELDWNEDQYSVAFQSRFGKQPWIQPYLDEHLESLVSKGVKNIAVVTPSFVSDCLETIHEIGIEYRDEFLEAGGEVFQLVPNLNDNPTWFNSVYQISNSKLHDVAGSQ
jgi:ferrochelatase